VWWTFSSKWRQEKIVEDLPLQIIVTEIESGIEIEIEKEKVIGIEIVISTEEEEVAMIEMVEIKEAEVEVLKDIHKEIVHQQENLIKGIVVMKGIDQLLIEKINQG
jgi:hypothetical protein